MTPLAAAKKRPTFDPKTFLSTIDGGRKIAIFLKKQTITWSGAWRKWAQGLAVPTFSL